MHWNLTRRTPWGNSYGTYQVELNKNWNKLSAKLYISHPYEDHSGMDLVNAVDNLIGVHIAFIKEKAHLQNLVLEYFHTKNQSGPYHFGQNPDKDGPSRGHDDYFNHGIYRSGATYHQVAMSSPLFAPIIIEDGISLGFENNRFSGFHVGAQGSITETFQWKGLFTYSNNFGHHDGLGGSTYEPSQKQVSALWQVSWQPTSKKLSISAAVANDHGSIYDNGDSTTRLGTMISFKYHFSR